MNAKISPAFEPILAGGGASDVRDAIVVFKPQENESVRVRGRLRRLKQRLDFIKQRAREQKPAQEQFLKEYQETIGKKSAREKLNVTEIGSGALPIAAIEITREALARLEKREDVIAVMPNQKIELVKPCQIDYARLKTQEKKSKLTWGLEALDVPKVWEKTRGAGINVAVLDTGVYAEHPALQERVSKFMIIDPLGRRIDAGTPFDGSNHGTHVCGTIAGGKTPEGVAIGVAPEANLLVAGVLVGEATLATLVEGISWAVESGADIINMSLGFTYYEPLFENILSELLRLDILPVVAIGNEYHGNTSSPGSAPSAFGVGAAEKMPRNKFEVAYFSSGASLEFPGSERALVTKPDAVAPGKQIYSCIPPHKTAGGKFEYNYMDGTSMATPHASGAAALLMAACPEAQAVHIMEALKSTARHPGGKNRPDNRWGYGLIRPMEALQALS